MDTLSAHLFHSSNIYMAYVLKTFGTSSCLLYNVVFTSPFNLYFENT